MSGGNAHDRKKFETAVEREVELRVAAFVRDAAGSKVASSPSIQMGNAPARLHKSLFVRLLDVLEQPLILTALFTLGGIVGAVIYTPFFIVWAICVLLGIHRSKFLLGTPPRVQVFVYVVLTILLSIGGYVLYDQLDSALDHLQTNFAKKVVFLTRQGRGEEIHPAPVDALSFDSYASDISYPDGEKVGEIQWKDGYVDIRLSIQTSESLVTELNLTVLTIDRDVNVWDMGQMGSNVPGVQFQAPAVPEAEVHFKDKNGQNGIISSGDMFALAEKGKKLPSIGDRYSLYCPRLLSQSPLRLVIAVSGGSDGKPPKSLKVSGSYYVPPSTELIKVDKTIQVRD